MAENNSVINFSTGDLQRYQNITSGNAVTALRVKYDEANRRLAIWQSRLNKLKPSADLVKNKIYNLYDLTAIEKQFLSNAVMTIEPIQSYAYTDIGFDGPHQSVSYDLNQLDARLPGILELKKEIDRINHDIQYATSQVRRYNKELQAYKTLLAANEAKGSGTTNADIAADKAQRSRYASVYYLYQMHLQYRDLTSDQNGKRAYPDTQVKIVRDILALKKVFVAHALSLGDLSKQLDLADPGADKNATVLGQQIGKLQTSMGDVAASKTEADVQKYISSTQTTTQSGWLSKGITRHEVPDLPTANSVAAATKSYPSAMVNFFGNTLNVGFTLTSALEMATKWWQKKISDTFVGLPPCDPPQFTQAQANQQALDAAQAGAESKGASAVQASDAKAAGAAAPKINFKDWFHYFTERFPGAAYGYVPNEIVAPGSPDNRQWLVTTGTGSGPAGIAQNNAAKEDDQFCLDKGFSITLQAGVEGTSTISFPWDLQDRVFVKIGTFLPSSSAVGASDLTYTSYSLRYIPNSKKS